MFAPASRFFHISLPSLYDYDVKTPIFTFHEGSKQGTTKFPFSFRTLIWFLGIISPREFPAFDRVSELEESRWGLTKKANELIF